MENTPLHIRRSILPFHYTTKSNSIHGYFHLNRHNITYNELHPINIEKLVASLLLYWSILTRNNFNTGSAHKGTRLSLSPSAVSAATAQPRFDRLAGTLTNVAVGLITLEHGLFACLWSGSGETPHRLLDQRSGYQQPREAELKTHHRYRIEAFGATENRGRLLN